MLPGSKVNHKSQTFWDKSLLSKQYNNKRTGEQGVTQRLKRLMHIRKSHFEDQNPRYQIY